MPLRQFTPLFKKPWNKRPEPKAKWRWRNVIWTATKRMAMAMGFMIIISALISVLLIGAATKESKPSIANKTVLYLPMKEGWLEHKSQGGFSFDLDGQKITVREIVDALDAGAKDKRVKGLVASYQGGAYNLAHLYEVRKAVERFKASGKFAYIFARDFDGGGTGGLGTYYLTSAFDEIWLQPMGTLSITGMNAETPYLRGLLDKIGVEPQFFARKEYKSVLENIVRSEPSAANTEMMTALLANIGSFVIDDIARDRGKTPIEMKTLIDRGLFLDSEAERLGLVTHVGYIDDLTKKIKTDIDGNPESENVKFPSLGYYGAAVKGEHSLQVRKNKKDVALIYLAGTIMPDEDGAGSKLSSALDVYALIMAAVEDDDVKIIVLRIDSPGGSPTASETIRRALVRAKEKNKQVIVSMGALTASGGYWVASAADHIFATPGTLTGSIGVAGGKVVLDKLWDKVGVNWAGVQYGENADLMSFNSKFSEDGERRFNALMDNIYNGFVARVAEGRDMSVENVDEIARGRVWSGAMARDLGLVDDIGGVDDALDYAAAQIGAKDRADVNVIILPKPKTTLEMLTEFLVQQVKMGDAFKVYAPALEAAAPMLEDMRVQSKSNGSPMIYDPVGLR